MYKESQECVFIFRLDSGTLVQSLQSFVFFEMLVPVVLQLPVATWPDCWRKHGVEIYCK